MPPLIFSGIMVGYVAFGDDNQGGHLGGAILKGLPYMGGHALRNLLMSYGRFRIPVGADHLVGHEEVHFEQNIIGNRVISTIFPRICLAP